ncbi:MAG: hypothetical protein R3C05_24060 [Pirellulaceae bacterium]
MSLSTRNWSKPRQPENYILRCAFAMLLLADVNPEQYEAPINRMANYYLGLQKTHGGFGYPNDMKGDNSQNQYAVLSMWSLRKAGFEIQPERMEALALYLIRTQDPSGMWGYFGVDSQRVGALVKQNSTRMSLTSAGAGSLLIAGDFFGFYANVAKRKSESEDDTGLPKAVHVHDSRAEAEAAKVKGLKRFYDSRIN